MARVMKRGKHLEVYEHERIQTNVRKRYVDLIQDPRLRELVGPETKFLQVDGTYPAYKVHSLILDWIMAD